MEEAVVGAVVGATIQIVLQNLLSSSMEEIGLIWNFKRDLQKLKNSLLLIQDFLEDAETKHVSDKSVQRWLMNLEAVAFDADHVFDELNYQLLRRKVQLSSRKLKKEVRFFFPNFKSLAFRCKMARKIKGIKNELKSINEEAMELGLQMRVASSHARGTGTDALTYLETDSFSEDPVFIGRGNEVEKMVEVVISSPTEEVVSVIPIVGMGGVGKTTFTRKVFNHSNIISHIEKRIWVHVSHDSFEPMAVLKKIAESSMGENVDGSREFVLQKLQSSLAKRRYLLVLDNVWNEDNDKWENFMSSLKGISSVRGNVIMVTTRSQIVANIVKTLDVHELGILSKQDCWLIIKSKAFGGNIIPAMFETIGENIAKRCGGLPLAAQVVGGMLRGKTELEWVFIEKSFLSSFGGEGNIVSKILKLSFDHLSSPLLKKCFAFCAMIPKGWSMVKDELIYYWMAEGFLQTDQDIDMELVGNNVFNILLHSSLLQVDKRDKYGNVERCILHELVYDLASSILNSKFLDGAHQVRYVCKSLIDESCPISKGHAKCLRALFFTGKIPNTMFSNLACIHVLILNDDEMKELPNEMGKLISLRFLDISLTSVECLPDSIGDLYHLQTLIATQDYGGESNLKKLPDTLKFLISLRNLYIPNIKLPPHIGGLTSLQTLPYFQVGDEEGCRITELRSLTKLKGAIEIYNLEKVGDKEEAETADLFHKNIKRLKFVWNEFRNDDQNNDENVLEGLQPHCKLESLKIEGFKGSNFPSWTLRMEVREDVENPWIRLDNLLEIELSDCKECEEIPMMGQLPNLKYLYLHRLSNVKCVSSSFYGKKEDDDVNEELVFPVLERLELIDMENLTTWAEVEMWGSQSGEVSVFPRLECLKIVNCRLLKSAPSHFPCLKELEIDNMESDTPLANICGSNLTSLTKLVLRKVDGMECLPDGLFTRNQHLIELEIRDCKNLSYLVQCLGDGGASLKKLMIITCRNLKSIGSKELSSPSFTSLHDLIFINCSGLTNLPLSMIESCTKSLEILDLTGSQRISNLPQVMRFVHKNYCLKELGIAGVPKLRDVVAEIESLRNLQWLTIGASSDCLDYNSFNAILDRIFPILQSLRVLALYGMEEWDALPEQLQHLTTLHTLSLVAFGVEVVPEWLEGMSSLRVLKLWYFPKLRSLPSKKAMQRLTELNIKWCPVLKQKLEGESARDGSEWSKISHIPKILVDELPFSPQPH